MDQKQMKRLVGYKAAELIETGMKVGIGTGSTVFYFIERLIERKRQGLEVQVAFSSKKSEEQAETGGIYAMSNDQITDLDITIDGADEIDPYLNMIKGGGGALLREKILATSSKKMVVIVDESKYSQNLGSHKLPIEITPFCFSATIQKINRLGYQGEVRKDFSGHIYVTDNNNYIYDLSLNSFIKDPRKMHDAIINIAGVVETGLFFDVASAAYIGYENGKVELLGNL